MPTCALTGRLLSSPSSSSSPENSPTLSLPSTSAGEEYSTTSPFTALVPSPPRAANAAVSLNAFADLQLSAFLYLSQWVRVQVKSGFLGGQARRRGKRPRDASRARGVSYLEFDALPGILSVGQEDDLGAEFDADSWGGAAALTKGVGDIGARPRFDPCPGKPAHPGRGPDVLGSEC